MEVCRVKEKESGSPDKKPPPKRKNSGRKSLKREQSTPTPIVVDESEEDNEWAYESGDEGKPEGHWERRDEKRARR